jgi:hypothetical protein
VTVRLSPRTRYPPICAASAWCWTIANAARKGRCCVGERS